jgi:hypothetical protein
MVDKAGEKVSPGRTETVDKVPEETLLRLSEIASLSREEIIERLLHFQGQCHLDFTPEYLALKSDDQLRHILVAACKHNGRH